MKYGNFNEKNLKFIHHPKFPQFLSIFAALCKEKEKNQNPEQH
jgi:hypothetical protein